MGKCNTTPSTSPFSAHQGKDKVALMVFKCLNNTAPSHLRACISVKDEPLKTLRTDQDYFLLKTPSVNNLVRTERGFSFSGPYVWNNLPYELRIYSSV